MPTQKLKVFAITIDCIHVQQEIWLLVSMRKLSWQICKIYKQNIIKTKKPFLLNLVMILADEM